MFYHLDQAPRPSTSAKHLGQAFVCVLSMKLKVKLLGPDGRVPMRATSGSAGYDLFASKSVSIDPGQTVLIDTDIAVCLPEGVYGRIAPRSSLAVKHGIAVMAGVIDKDFRGHVRVALLNTGGEALIVNKHDRVAQLLLERIETPDIVVVDCLDETERGAGGFGSTGK